MDAMDATARSLDDLDRSILRALSANARATGASLAAAAGIAESTVSLRLRRLHDDGYIRGYRADLDLAAIGATVQALIAVRLVKHVREDVEAFTRDAPEWPGVLNFFHMGGADDYLLHIAARNATDVRDFMLRHLASHPAVGHTETNLVFEHVPGRGVEHLLAP